MIKNDEKLSKTVLEGLTALLSEGTTVSESRIADAIAVLNKEKNAVAVASDSPLPREDMERPMKPRVAAKLLGISTKALAYHARMGRIRVVRPTGAKRIIGYVAADIYNLLRGVRRAA